MKSKNGISLIILVITIVVIIILAAAVILNLGKNNPIDNARKAKIVQTLDTFKSDLGVQVANRISKNTNLEVIDIDSKDEDGWRIADLVPSIKGTEYESELIVVDGKLKLRDDSTLLDETKEIIKEALGESLLPKVEGTIITKSMIENEPSKYIGESVVYTGYAEKTNTIDWKLFGFDESGNIMLKANNYIDLTYKISSYPAGVTYLYGERYRILSKTSRDDLINYIGNKDNFSEYAISGKTQARGAMTLQEFVNGYNLVNDTKLECKYLKAGENYPDNSSKTANADGYIIKKGTENYSTSTKNIQEKYKEMNFYDENIPRARGIWLASESAFSKTYMMYIPFTGKVDDNMYSNNAYGICPVVSITSGFLVQKTDGTLVVE